MCVSVSFFVIFLIQAHTFCMSASTPHGFAPACVLCAFRLCLFVVVYFYFLLLCGFVASCLRAVWHRVVLLVHCCFIMIVLYWIFFAVAFFIFPLFSRCGGHACCFGLVGGSLCVNVLIILLRIPTTLLISTCFLFSIFIFCYCCIFKASLHYRKYRCFTILFTITSFLL